MTVTITGAVLNDSKMPHIRKKDILYLFAIILLFSSCISSTYNLENKIGLYKVIETECSLTQGEFNPCNEIRFIEIVKGQFFGIEPDQLALVFWRSGDDPELLYEVYEIRNHRQKLQEEKKIWLTNEHIENEKAFFILEDKKEFFIIESGKITDYIFHLQQKNQAGEVFIRDFRYKLSPISRSEIVEFKLNYPVDE